MKKSIQESLALTKLAETRWGPKRKWRCVYCGRGAGIVLDHLWPSSVDGGNDRANLFPACDRCNGSKMDRDPWAWMAAVGVPERRQDAIRTLIADPSIIPRSVPTERFELDYDAARAIMRPERPSRVR
ncbi:HNH endonuclease [Microbacterium phage Franklin22]|uniref:HNH endonuclease n=1 Tax=Microbacterium phage Franklin22 TaxID=2894293 RepID=UPI001E7536F2|nr:HNH endonuclease [Microbacterium phage Franklin22]UGL61864.1 HNH endonuclease [Microbacterium phage Franklin22]